MRPVDSSIPTILEFPKKTWTVVGALFAKAIAGQITLEGVRSVGAVKWY
jgi:hypothetical protein